MFIILHLVAVFFMPVALFLTIPLHLIYSAVHKKAAAPKPWTHVKCPDCKELVHNEANVCRHCGCKLIPVSQQPQQSFFDWAFKGSKTVGTKYGE